MLPQRKNNGTHHQRASQFLFRLNPDFVSADSAECWAGMPGMLKQAVFGGWAGQK
jgi:hypothetical protein